MPLPRTGIGKPARKKSPTRTARDFAATNPGHAQFASEMSDLLNGRPVVNFGMGWQ
jgi:hypothetical protein